MGAVRRIEIPAVGLDEAMQLTGSDPFGSRSHVGLRVPFLPTATVTSQNGNPIWKNRYLFLACAFAIGQNQVARILGWRQLITIGVKLNVLSGQTVIGHRYVEQLVTSPFWHFPDGDVSFHITRMGGPNNQGTPFGSPRPQTIAGAAFRKSFSPALLWENIVLPGGDPFYVDLTQYKPPNGARPYGHPLADGHQGTFTDQRTQWTTHGAWNALDLDVEGQGTIAGYISVNQTDPSSALRAIPNFPPNPFYPAGLSSEEQFLLNFSGAQYFRVGMSLVVQIGDRRDRPRVVRIGTAGDPSSEEAS